MYSQPAQFVRRKGSSITIMSDYSTVTPKMPSRLSPDHTESESGGYKCYLYCVLNYHTTVYVWNWGDQEMCISTIHFYSTLTHSTWQLNTALNYFNREFWNHVNELSEQLGRLTEQDELKATKSKCAISLSLLKRDTMSVRAWLTRCATSRHTCMEDLIYVYHGLTPLLKAYSTKMQSLKLDDTDRDHAQLIQLLEKKLVRGCYFKSFIIIKIIAFNSL